MLCLVTQSCPSLCDPLDYSPPGSSIHGDSPGKNTGVGCHALLQGIFPTQGSNPGLPHCRQIRYHLSHQGSPRILEVSSLSLLQKIFPTQGLNPGFPHYRQILYHLNHQGSPRILEVSSLSLLQGIIPTQEIELGSPALQVDSLPVEPPGKPKS